MVQGYGVKANMQELFFMLLMIIGFILLIPYILKQLIKSSVTEGANLIKEGVTEAVAVVKAPAVDFGNNVVTPLVSTILQNTYPDGMKVNVLGVTYGSFATPPDPILYDIGLQYAQQTLRAGGGIIGADGFRYVDREIDGRITRYVLQADGFTVAPMSLSPNAIYEPYAANDIAAYEARVRQIMGV